MKARRAVLAAAAAAGGVAGWALLAEPMRLAVRRVELALPAWPAALDGVTVALVSDLHAGGPHVGPERVAAVVAAIDREEPDLALLLGDYVDPNVALGTRVAPEDVAAALGRLHAPMGRVAVLGNHDWAFDGPRVRRALTTQGIVVLENGTLPVARRPAPLWVAGVADATERRPDVNAALAAVPADAAVLLLSHDPDVFPRVPARVALTVSGHTHGGQVDLPGVPRRVIPSRFGDRYARGHVVEGGRHLFVTSGVGTSRLPIRLARPPEIVVLKLRAAS